MALSREQIDAEYMRTIGRLPENESIYAAWQASGDTGAGLTNALTSSSEFASRYHDARTSMDPSDPRINPTGFNAQAAINANPTTFNTPVNQLPQGMYNTIPQQAAATPATGTTVVPGTTASTVPGANTAVTGANLQQHVQNQVNSPQLTPNTTFNPTLMQAQSNEMMTGNGATVNPNMPPVATPGLNTQAGQVQPLPGATPTSQQVSTPTQAQGQTYEATTVMDRYADMMNNFDPSNPPAWAKGAVKTATQQANARGLGASTMALEGTTAAIMEAAKPIAMEDAKIINAAKQFNATSIQQAIQFYQTLSTDIEKNNATRADAMSQFERNVQAQMAAVSANNAKDMEIAKANITADIAKFNQNMADQRERFNASNQLIIEQSNTQWRRSINTSNTAAINAANQLNVQNQFNMSQWALAALWQQARDEASWAQSASENELTRAHNVAMAALQRDANMTLLSTQQKNDIYAALGTWAAGAVNGLIKGT